MASFGIDSSNYRSSAAVYHADGRYSSHRRLLPVALGQKGLRQSDAVFAHVKQLPELVSNTLGEIDVSALRGIGVSDRPRRLVESYMPCFLVGVGLAKTLAASLGLPLYRFSHQEGHIAAALLSADCLHLLQRPFVAFHVSGGTTEALLVHPADLGFSVEIIAKTLDLNIGQVIDRAGVMLGLSFPSGEALERLAENGRSPIPIRPCLKGVDPALSGVENQCKKLLNSGAAPADIAAFTLEYAAEVLWRMSTKLREQYGDLPFVYSGGVMANAMIKRRLGALPDTYFASPELSGDNAVGIALLAELALEKDSCNKSV